MSAPQPPRPGRPERLGWDGPPVAKVQRVGTREFGPMAWEAWVSAGLTRYQGEWGTYAWTRKGAERKARRLLRKYEATRRGGPEIEVGR